MILICKGYFHLYPRFKHHLIVVDTIRIAHQQAPVTRDYRVYISKSECMRLAQ